MNALLYCADPLRPRQVDAHFASEAALARDLGARIALIDHDALLAGRPDDAVARVPADLGPAWYRGWMIPSDRYAALDAALHQHGVRLATTPGHYQAAHELPGWYPLFAPASPASAWTPCAPRRAPDHAALARLAEQLPPGPGIVKDYVKSRKHDWHTACYLPNLTDTAAVHHTVGSFVDLQDDALTGGIVLRAFEPFDTATGEARVWWLDAAPILISAHPDTPHQCPSPDVRQATTLVAAFDARFITTDLALRNDGAWRIVEVGDGQVSDLPSGTNPTALLTALITAATESEQPPGEGEGAT